MFCSPLPLLLATNAVHLCWRWAFFLQGTHIVLWSIWCQIQLPAEIRGRHGAQLLSLSFQLIEDTSCTEPDFDQRQPVCFLPVTCWCQFFWTSSFQIKIQLIILRLILAERLWSSNTVGVILSKCLLILRSIKSTVLQPNIYSLHVNGPQSLFLIHIFAHVINDSNIWDRII